MRIPDRLSLASVVVAFTALPLAWTPVAAQVRNLPTSKEWIGPIPGHPEPLSSLPMSMAVSPDGRYIAVVNAGYGTALTDYEQSIAILDTTTGKLRDFPDTRTMVQSHQTLYSGLAFSTDGTRLYVSMGSLTDPLGTGKDDTGSGIVVYDFRGGAVTPAGILHLPLEPLAHGRTTRLLNDREGDKGVPFPAAIVRVREGGADKLLVADNLSDMVLVMNAATGAVEHRFDLSESNAVPSTYPIALALSKDGRRAYAALWNASEIVELDLTQNMIGRRLALLKPRSPIAPGTHPCAFALSPDGRTLYVALANRDAVAAVDVGGGRLKVKGYFDTRLPGQSYFGAEPVSIALNAQGTRLYVANMATDSVAVMDTRKLTPRAARKGMVEPDGFIPTDWMPFCLTFLPSQAGGRLYIATAKGQGTGPNNKPMTGVGAAKGKRFLRPYTYIASMLHGSLATLESARIDAELPHWTQVALESNRMKSAQQKIAFADGRPNPIKHVIYIIKENRTYDQVLGDLTQNGKPVGNGDPDLTMYGEAITPNIHRLALQFGVLDNFYDSGEVSGEGHVWSNAAIGTDYLEKTWQQGYRGAQRTYDYEGVVAEGLPLEQHIPDVNEPASGYLWGDLAAHHKSYYHFGEYISSVFCNEVKTVNPQQGPMLAGGSCARKAIEPGQEIPAEWGGGVSKYHWAIPLLASNSATKPELVGHFAAEAPDFNLAVPDQIRVNIFMRHLKQWIADKERGRDTMPNFVMLRLPDDHTAGTRPGMPTPQASVADNDLAVGRAVDAISHSPFWNDTAFFILEDDAQDGADHVDAHRSYALVISKYAPRGAGGAAFVDSHFYSTVSVIRTMEMVLGLPPMNNNDAFAPVIASLFAGPGNQTPYSTDYANQNNGLIYKANTQRAYGAAESMKMDFRHADRAPAEKLNVILWKQAMGNKPVPAMLKNPVKTKAKDGDDD
ncbi:MAG TPA: bifunctional YncE family protein/alkaline phosphatase family protein [Terracidiphilus sp.]|nr:bifunctional YncE family protein/alkaline phosphatase family protein [Terracidiphilus sp.]